MTVINEAGLYKLVMRSKLPNAEKFSDWVCEKVLPSICKTGLYITPNAPIASRFLRRMADKFVTRCLPKFLASRVCLKEILNVEDKKILILSFGRIFFFNEKFISVENFFGSMFERGSFHGKLFSRGNRMHAD